MIMDERPDDCHISEATANSDLVAVCDECCIDGSLESTDSDVAASSLAQRTEADEKCQGECSDFTAADPLSMDNMQANGDIVDNHISSVDIRSSSNDCTDALAAGTDKSITRDVVNGMAVNEPVINPIDVYGGLQLAARWNVLRAQRQRELGVGQVAASQFTCQASSSLGLVRRLQLYSKLDGHTGCVNALHFNDAGK